MRLAAIVVLVFGGALSACEQRPDAAGSSLVSAPQAARVEPGQGSGSHLTASDTTSSGNRKSSAAATASGVADAGFREVTLPAGTMLPLVLDSAIGSDTSRVEESVNAHLSRPIVVQGVTVLPTGSPLTGVVTSAVRSGKVKGRAHIAMRFDRIARRGEAERYDITTSAVRRTAPATKKEDTLKVVAPAAGGAIIGRIAGGRKGAAIGTAVGAGAGGAVVMSTRGKEVRLGKGALVSVRLAEPLVVRVPKG
jgi:hypothetical protein